MQRCGQCYWIVAIGGSVLGDPVKVRVPTKCGRTAVQPSRHCDRISVGEDRMHGEFWKCVIA
jgi:hypothetical protein